MTGHGAPSLETGSPFPGLRPYGYGDAAVFHGRSEEIRSLAAVWDSSRVTILHGAAGTGKTSLVQAGVYPLLHGEGHDVVAPGRLARFADLPSGALPETGQAAYSLLRGWLPEMLPTAVADVTVGQYLDELARRPGLVFLAVDQVERLFRTDDHERHRVLLAELREAVRRHPSLHVLFSVRSGYEQKIAEEFAFAAPTPFEITGLSTARAAAAVRAAIGASGHQRSMSRAAADALARALGSASGSRGKAEEPGHEVHPPALQHVAAGLWRSWPQEAALGPERISRGLVTKWIAEGLWEDLVWAAALASTDPEHIVDLLRSLGSGSSLPLPREIAEILADRYVIRGVPGDLHTVASARLIEPIEELSRQASSLPRPSFRAGEWLDAAAQALDSRDTRRARHAALTALDLAEGMRHGLQARLLLGDLAYETGDPAEAEHFYTEAAALAEANRAGSLVGALLTSVGRIQMDRGDTGSAIQSLSSASARLPGDGLVSRELDRACAQVSAGWAASRSSW